MAQISQLEQYVASALEIVEFKLSKCLFFDPFKSENHSCQQLPRWVFPVFFHKFTSHLFSVRDGQSVADAGTFHPEMAHQIFGEKENIFGYKDLKVHIYYSAGPLDVYFKTSYSKKIDDLKLDGMKADDIDKAVTELMPGGCVYTNLEEFLSIVGKKTPEFKPVGEKVFEFSIPSGASREPESRAFEIYQCNMNTPNFLKYHGKFESMIFWFVDAASHIIHDQQWEFFVVWVLELF